MAKEKARYFTFLLYPESIPSDWEQKLESLDIQMAVSPLHDKDLSDVEGQRYKKAHYHVIYVAKNPVTVHAVRMKIKRLLGDQSLAKVQIVRSSMENMYLYLTHESKDAIAKNKQKYKKSEIKLINSFDIDRFVTLDVTDKEDILNLVCEIIDEYSLANMRELRRFLLARGKEVGLPNMRITMSVLRSYTGLIRLHFDAVYQERKYGRSDVNYDTGEIKE